MNNNELCEKLRQLDIEDFIWIIYIGIIFMSWYSNGLERKYFLYSDEQCKEKYRKTMILIFSILVVVYIYFLKDSIDSIRKLKENDSYEKKKLVFLSFFGSLLIAISGFLFLYIAFSDQDIDVELAFN